MVFTNLICSLYSAIYENTVSWLYWGYERLRLDSRIGECRLFGFEIKNEVVFFIRQMAIVSAVLRSSAQNGIGRRKQPVLSNLFLITNQNKYYLLFLIWAHKKIQTVAPSVRGTSTTTKQPLLLLRFLIFQSTFPYLGDLYRKMSTYLIRRYIKCSALLIVIKMNFKI